MAGAPDLFVVCKNCQSEVSPYITECPYCGQRLRKRAPKLDRDGRPSEPMTPPPPPPKVAQPRKPKPPRLRPVRPERPERPARSGSRRVRATFVLVVVALVVTLGYQAGIWPIDSLIVSGAVETEWWRLLTSSFVYVTSGYEAVALTTIALFGWLLERRHGAWATLVVYVLGAVVGAAMVVLLDPGDGVSLGGYAPALALLCAWAMRDILTRRRGGEVDADMLGLAVWFVVLALLPLATGEAHILAGLGGALVGVVLGLSLARMAER